MKRIVAVFMAIVLVLSCSFTAFAADDSGTKLKFNEDGKFKILLLADIQDGYPIKEDYLYYINQALDKAKPDLIIMLGDNIVTAADNTVESYWKAYDQVLEPFVSRNIPFTLVFGNHDDESVDSVCKEEMLQKYQSYKGCLAYDADPSLHGCATHNLEILSSDGKKIAFNLWMMDSGDYAVDENGVRTGYDCVRKDQIEWYKNKSTELKEKNGGEVVPSMMFQHIVPQEVYQKVMFNSPWNLGDLTINFADGTSSTYLANIFNYDGYVMEPPCPSLENDGQWDALVETGDVLSVFFGHDHPNSYRTEVNGIKAVNVPGVTYNSYYSYIEQGSMLVTLDENDIENYQLDMLYSNDLALEEGSKLPGLKRSMNEYLFSKVCRCGLALISAIRKSLFSLIIK